MSLKLRPRQSLWALIAVLHILAAIFSKGYHHPDEQFQILEFAHHAVAATPADELAWEHDARIRPWLQPAFYAMWMETLDTVGVHNPFEQTFVLRLVSAIIGFLSIVAFARASERWITSDRVRWFAIAALGLAWYAPYLHARTSSENLATSFICFALACFVSSERRDLLDERITSHAKRWGLLAGMSAGAAFESRFQMGLMIAGLFAWLLRYRRDWRLIGSAVVGFAAVFAIGRLVDHWGYGDWTVTPLAYFRVNLVEAKASAFGVQPWWWYFKKIVNEIPPPVGLVFVIGVPIMWWRMRSHVITWATVPFFVAHMLIGHKELRFLFPLLPLCTVLLIIGTQGFLEGLNHRPAWMRRVAVILVIPNLFFCVLNCLRPTRGEFMALEAIYKQSRRTPDIYVVTASPFFYRELPFRYYVPPHMEVHYLDDVPQLMRTHFRKPSLVYFESNWLPPGAESLATRCKTVHRSFPDWVNKINVRDWLSRTYQAYILECGS